MIKSTGIILLASIATLAVSCGRENGEYDASGAFEVTEVIVSSEAAGKIIFLDLQEGEEVREGQIVAVIDSTQLYLKKLQLEASLRALEKQRPDTPKQIGALEQQITTAKAEQQRVENLLKANAANQKQMDDIQAQIAVLEKQLSASRSSLQSANESITAQAEAMTLQIKQLQDQLNKCRITSPITGTILNQYCEKGEMAMPGKALFRVADTRTMILRAYITADQLTRLKIGQTLKVYADFGEKASRDYPGTISWISSNAEFTPKTIQTRDERAHLVYAVKVTVSNDGYLKIGMYGNLRLN